MADVDSNPVLSKLHHDVNPLKARLLRQYLIPGSVLDVGCGNGLYGFACQTICTDITQLDLVDRRDPKARIFDFVAGNASASLFAPGSFDNIIAFDIVEHLEDDAGFVEKTYRELSNGGRLFVSVPNEDNSLLERLDLAHIHYTDKTHKREYSAGSLQRLLEQAGFAVLHIGPNINRSLVKLPGIMARRNPVSKLVASLCTYQLRLLAAVGLLENKVVADWLAVASKKQDTIRRGGSGSQ